MASLSLVPNILAMRRLSGRGNWIIYCQRKNMGSCPEKKYDRGEALGWVFRDYLHCNAEQHEPLNPQGPSEPEPPHRQRLPAVHQEQVFLLRRMYVPHKQSRHPKIAEAIQSGSRIQRRPGKQLYLAGQDENKRSRPSPHGFTGCGDCVVSLWGQGSVRWLPSMDFPCLVYCHQAATSHRG